MNTIRVVLTGSVLAVTLDRPAQRNAMSLEMVAELRAVFSALPHAARVVVLRGTGGNFCAGGDLADMAKARMAPLAQGRDPIAVLSEQFGRLCLDVSRCEKPVVAVLEGAVIGGGFGLACVADIAIAHEGARFRLSETSLGLVPAQIAPFLVARLGYAAANRLALTAAVLTGRQALELGLAHEVADSVRLEAAYHGVVMSLLRSPPGALAATKALLRRAREEPAEILIGDAADIFAAAARGAEAAEGLAAFLQKRAPHWAAAE